MNGGPVGDDSRRPIEFLGVPFVEDFADATPAEKVLTEFFEDAPKR